MLTERLREVVEMLGQLPDEEQDSLGAAIRAELEEDGRWTAAMDDSHDFVLDHLLSEAKRLRTRGGEQ